MNRKIVKHYNVHDILTFQVVCDNERSYLQDFNFPFSYFEVESVEQPSIILNIGSFEPINSECDIVFNKYHIKEGYIYCREKEGFAKWQVEFDGIEDDETIVNFAWERKTPKTFVAPCNFPQIAYLEPLIDYKLSQIGYCLLHASGVSMDGKAMLFEGRGGASKRHLASSCLNEFKCKLVGDDRVILRKDGSIFCFPKYVQLIRCLLHYNYTKDFTGLFRKLRTALTMMYDADFSSQNLEIIDCSKMEQIYLVYGSEIPYTYLNRSKMEDMINSVVHNNAAEMYTHSHFINSFNAYSYVFGESFDINYSKNLTRNLKNGFVENTKCNRIAIGNDRNKRTNFNVRELLVET